MWRLLSRIFFIVIIFSFSGFGEDFEKICNQEVLKEDFNVSVVRESCLKAAQKELKSKSFSNASWYFLLAGKITKNIDEIQAQIDDGMFLNIGHSYLLRGNLDKASKYYSIYIEKENQPNKALLADFKLLQKLYPKKKKLLHKGLKIWRKLYKPLLTLDTLYHTYQREEKEENYEEAIKKLQEVILLRKNYSKIDTKAISIDYNNLSLLYGDFGNYTKSLKYMLITLEIDKRLFHKEHHHIAVTYSNLGFIYEKLSKYKDAEKYHLLALKTFQNLSEKDDIAISTTYNNLAFLYSSIGKYTKALKFYKKALFIDKKHVKENYSTISITLNNLGELYSLLGDYPKAMEYYQDTLKIDIEHNGKKHTSTAHSYNNIAHLYELLEDYIRAEDYYNKALTIAKDKLDKNHPFLATIYANLGNLYYVMEEDIKSFQKHKKALDIRTILAKEEASIDLAHSYHAMGLLYQSSEDYNKSLEYYQKTLDTNEKLLSKDNIANSVTYSSMGTIYQQMNKKKEALKFYLKALKLEKKILGKNHRDLARSYNNLSLLFFSQKDNSKAYAYIKKAFEIFKFNKNQNFRLLDNRQKINYTEKVNYYFNNLLYLINLNRSQQNFQKGFNYWLNYKGTLFEYQNILSMVKNNPNTPKETINTISKLNQLNSQLSNTKEKEEEKRIEEKIHQIEIQLSEKNESLKRILSLNDINTTQIKNHLKPHQLYIDFARGYDNYYIFTLDKQNNIGFQKIDQIHTKEIDQNIKIYRENTTNIAYKLNRKTLTLGYEKLSHKKAKNILSQLYTTLIEKYLQGIIKDKTDLIISPDGLLNYFPFEALYHNGKYLVEDYSINYISSGKEFVRQTKIKEKKPVNEMTIFANANFNALVKGSIFDDEPESKVEKAPLKPLGDREMTIIQKYYPKAVIFDTNKSTVNNLLNMPSSKIIHISTHGKILKDPSILNPMRKALLYFAGANVASNKGTISALKLSSMDFKYTELIVLSACESGLGSIQNAEGVIGLPKALFQAGVKNVIMSLWTVSNKKTAMLMDSFYANILNKQDYNTALQNAKKEMIKTHPHPYYWSAFILNGL